jgi:SAM-dependent methyltransferase
MAADAASPAPDDARGAAGAAGEDVREVVRARYAAAALRSAAGAHDEAGALEVHAAQAEGCCGSAGGGGTGTVDTVVVGAPAAVTSECCGSSEVAFGGQLYDPAEAAGAPAAAVAASLGCGVPTAVADLRPGEVVLDLGSGAGADVLISARRVTPGGRVYGVDMTSEMLELARANAAAAGVDNVEFLQGYLEDIPLPDASVDVVISNCVINLAADKAVVLREAARVLRPGGRFAVSDVIADEDMDAITRADTDQWTGCVAGALTRAEFERALRDAGLGDVEITRTHRVHEHAASAIVRARKPQHAPRRPGWAGG